MSAIVQPQDTALEISGLLDPRTSAFQEAIRLTPATLAHYRTNGKWIAATHLLYAAAEIAHEVAKGDAHIIFEIPPRHGKSELASVHTPIWFLDRWPHLSVILTTYAADLSEGFGRRVRDAFLEDDGQFLRAQVRSDVSRTDVFQTTEGGGMMSVGIGGPITGRGANLLIIDDYVKNFVEAMSESTNEQIWNWFLSTAYTRLEPGGSVIILATRWPSPNGDLIGRILAKEPGKWRVIRLPALAEAGDPLGRVEGAALWPQRYTKERLLRIRSLLGAWLFDSMYQQDPKDAAGISVDINQLRYVDKVEHPLDLRWVRSWDIASTDRKRRKKSDFTVGSLLGTEGRPGSPFMVTYIADQVRGQWAPHIVEQTIRDTAEADGFNIPITIEQEPGSSGKAYAEHLATNVLAGFSVTIVPSSGSKVVKAQPYVAAVNHGRISLVRAEWNKAHKEELKSFPSATHDDTVDSAAQAYNYLFQTAVLTPTWGRNLGAKTLSKIQQPKTSNLVTGAVWGRSR